MNRTFSSGPRGPCALPIGWAGRSAAPPSKPAWESFYPAAEPVLFSSGRAGLRAVIAHLGLGRPDLVWCRPFPAIAFSTPCPPGHADHPGGGRVRAALVHYHQWGHVHDQHFRHRHRRSSKTPWILSSSPAIRPSRRGRFALWSLPGYSWPAAGAESSSAATGKTPPNSAGAAMPRPCRLACRPGCASPGALPSRRLLARRQVNGGPAARLRPTPHRRRPGPPARRGSRPPAPPLRRCKPSAWPHRPGTCPPTSPFPPDLAFAPLAFGARAFRPAFTQLQPRPPGARRPLGRVFPSHPSGYQWHGYC